MKVLLVSIFGFVLFCLLPMNGSAQVSKVNWGEVYKTSAEYEGGVRMIGKEGNHYYVLSGEKKRNKKILKYNLKNEVISEQKVELKYQDKKLNLLHIIKTKEKTYGISERVNKKKNQFEILVSEFKEGNFLSTNLVFEHKYEKKIIQPSETKNKDVKGFMLSADSSKIVFINSTSSKDKMRKDEILVATFDNDFKLLWSKIQEVPYSDKKFLTKRIMIANNGVDLMLIGKYKKWKIKEFFEHKILHLTKNEFKEYDVPLKDPFKPVTIVSFYKEEDQSLFITGVYSTIKEKTVKGIFCGSIDLAGKGIRGLKYHPFSKKEQKEFSESQLVFSIAEFRELENGNYQFLAEKKRKLEYKDKYDRAAPPKISFSYNDFMFVTIEKGGEKIKTFKLDRKLNTHYDRKGYSCFFNGDITYLVYDSNIRKKDKEKFNLKASKIHVITKVVALNKNGELLSTDILFDSKKTKYRLDDIIALYEEDHLFFGGKIKKNVQGPKAIHGKKAFQFGVVTLAK